MPERAAAHADRSPGGGARGAVRGPRPGAGALAGAAPAGPWLAAAAGLPAMAALAGGAWLPLQARLRVGSPGDAYEREADHVADTVLRMPAPSGAALPISQVRGDDGGAPVQRRCAKCGGSHGEGDADGYGVVQRKCSCEQDKDEMVHRREKGGGHAAPGGSAAPGPGTAFTAALAGLRAGGGAPLAPRLRGFFEPRFGHDLGGVRLHTGPLAERSAEAVAARAFTVGNDIVFGRGELTPDSASGRHLLAHELTHVVQQTPRVARRELLVQRQAAGATAAPAAIQDAAAAAPVSAAAGIPAAALGKGFQVCSRQTAVIPGLSFNHGFIDTPSNRYALLGRCRPKKAGGPGIPLVSGADLGLPLNPTAAKTLGDAKDEPCGKTPHCVPCRPRAGVADLGKCFSDTFRSYPSPAEYVVFPGPNSNTFTSTMARSCCQEMESPPPALGRVPGWGHSVPSPLDATCSDKSGCGDTGDVPRADKPGGILRGILTGGLLGGGVGAGIGAVLGGLIGLIGGPMGALAGLKIGALAGAAIGGLVGAGAGGYAGSQ